jgi:subtilisin family serine protease
MMKYRGALSLLGIVGAAFSAASALAAAPPPAQSVGERVIVVFHHDAPFQSFPPAVVHPRARVNPAAWSYLDRGVLGLVQFLERQHGFRAEHAYSAAVRGFAARLTRAQIEAMRRDPMVAYVERDVQMRLLEQVLPWGVDRIDADISSTLAGDHQGSVENVNVYILDNGVDRNHPDLNVVNHVNFTGAANHAACAHGTRVAGVVAAMDNDSGVVGVLPGAPITAVKVTTCDPVFLFASAVIKGVDWVTQNARKPAVANMSIGGFPNFTLDTAVKRSADSGVLYLIAAGNSSMDACFTSPQRTGRYPGIMTVAATAADDTEASFSNYGRCVDIWAPGASILTTDLGGGTVTSSGTSYAAPHVAGAAGLYLSKHPAASPSEVEATLKSDALFPGTSSRDGQPVRLVYAGTY